MQRQKLCARRTYKTLANPQQHLVPQTYKILAHPLRNFETRQLTSPLPTSNADNAGSIEEFLANFF
jgi:predicted transposase YdaD